jgi:hypothetical protein
VLLQPAHELLGVGLGALEPDMQRAQTPQREPRLERLSLAPEVGLALGALAGWLWRRKS